MCCHAGLEDALIFVEIANSTSEMSPAFNLFASGQYGTLTLVRPPLLNRDRAYSQLPWQHAECGGIGPGQMVTWECGSQTSTLITFVDNGYEIEGGLGELMVDVGSACNWHDCVLKRNIHFLTSLPTPNWSSWRVGVSVIIPRTLQGL